MRKKHVHHLSVNWNETRVQFKYHKHNTQSIWCHWAHIIIMFWIIVRNLLSMCANQRCIGTVKCVRPVRAFVSWMRMKKIREKSESSTDYAKSNEMDCIKCVNSFILDSKILAQQLLVQKLKMIDYLCILNQMKNAMQLIIIHQLLILNVQIWHM